MTSSERTRLDSLRDASIASKCRAKKSRETLIESLGDRMCGSGDGPSSKDIAIYAELREAAERDAEEFARLLNVLARRGAQAGGVHRAG